MANYATLKAAIAAAIKQNGNNEITGNLLQQQLLAMANSLGVGYQYVGIATRATNPGTPDQNVFYFASTPGTYPNFGGIQIADGEICIIKGSGTTWIKETTGAGTYEQITRLTAFLRDSFDIDSFIIPGNYEIRTGSLGGNSRWYISGATSHIIVPVTPGERFLIKSSGPGLFGFLTNAHEEPVVNNTPINYSSGTNRMSATTLQDVIAPQDAAYLCLVMIDGGQIAAGWEYIVKCGENYVGIEELYGAYKDKVEFVTAVSPLVINNQNRVFNLYNGISIKVKGGPAISIPVSNVPFGSITVVSGWACLVYNIQSGTLSVKQYYNTDIANSDVIIAIFRISPDNPGTSPDTFTITSVYFTMLSYQLFDTNNVLIDKSINYSDLLLGAIDKVEFVTSTQPLVIDNANKHFNLSGGFSVKVNGGNAISVNVNNLAFGTVARGTGWACLVYNIVSGICSVKQYFYSDITKDDIIIAIFRIQFEHASGNPDTFTITSVYFTMLAYQLIDADGIIQKSIGYPDVVDLQMQIDDIVGGENNINIPNFEMGYIAADGTQGYNAASIRSSDFIPVSMSKIYCKGDIAAMRSIIPSFTAIMFNVHCYDVNKVSIGRTPQGVQNVDNGASFDLLPGTKFVKFTSSDSLLIDLSGSLSLINSNKSTIYSVKQFSTPLFVTQEEYAKGIRTMLDYDGEKITLDAKCDYKNIFNLRDAGVYNQGAAIYGNYLFAFHTGNTIVDVYDLTTNTLVQTINVSENPQGENHANNADFGVDFADESDIFPLLYVTTNTNDEIWVYRVSGTIGNLVMTKQQIINLDVVGNGIWGISSFAVDKENKKIVFAGFKNANYDVSVNNPIVIGWFELPPIDSDQQIAIADTHYNTAPWIYAIQGIFARAGKVYVAFGNTHVSAGICIYDYNCGILTNKIKIETSLFGDYFEPEGLCYYNNSIIMTSQHLKVYQFTF